MLDMRNQRQKRQQTFMDAVEGISFMAALIAALGLTPTLYNRTIFWVLRFVDANYAMGFDDLVKLAWFAMLGFLTFFVARATLATAIVAAGLALAVRFV
jgi:hypothetical protein